MARVPSILRSEQRGTIERFYQLLLLPDHHANALTVIDEALHLIATITRATTAYIEMFGADVHAMSRGYDVEARPPDVIGASVSRDVVTQAVAERRMLAFESRADKGVVTTMCVPIGTDGVIGIVGWRAERAAFPISITTALDCLLNGSQRLVRPVLDERSANRCSYFENAAFKKRCSAPAGTSARLHASSRSVAPSSTR